MSETLTSLEESSYRDSESTTTKLGKWIWRRRHDVLFVSVLILAFIWRLAPLLAHGSPTGNDWGTYLLIGHQFFGHTVARQGLTYPPLVPILVTVLNSFMPITVITSVIGAASGVLPYAGIYIALRAIGPSFIWNIAPLPLLISASISELVAFGGAPQLIANSCFPVVAVSAALLLDSPTRKRAVIFAVSVFILAASSEEVFGQIIICLFILLILESISQPRSIVKRIHDSWKYFALGLAPLLLLLPIYASILKQVGLSQETHAGSIYTPSFNWQYLTRDDHLFWNVCLLISSVIAYYSLLHTRSRVGPLLRAGFSILIVALLFLVFVPQIRFSYLAPVSVCFSLALIGFMLTRYAIGKWSLALNLIIAATFLGNVAIQFQSSSSELNQLINFYGELSPSALDLNALNYIKIHTPAMSLLAVTSVGSYAAPIGWWIEGYSERRALVQGSSNDLYYAVQRKESLEATKIFSSFPSIKSLKLAKTYDVRYLAVFRNWSGFNALTTHNFLVAHPKWVAFSNANVIIVKVPEGKLP
jgi:hypothetical protein